MPFFTKVRLFIHSFGSAYSAVENGSKRFLRNVASAICEPGLIKTLSSLLVSVISDVGVAALKSLKRSIKFVISF